MRTILSVLCVGFLVNGAIGLAIAQTGASGQIGEHKTPLPTWPQPVVTLYVAPDGSDAATGTIDAPLASLEAARDALRQRRSAGTLGDGGALVVVRGGRYQARKSFTLNAEDSGTATAPVRYRVADGEVAIFSGGIRLEGFSRVSDEAVLARLEESARDKVVCVPLDRFGLFDLKPLQLGGFNSGLGFTTKHAMELFFDSKAMPMSRWPNEGFARVAGVASDQPTEMHGRKGSKVGRLVYDGDRPARWKDENAAMLYGYWFFDWADSYERIASIDLDKREIALQEPYCGYGYRAGAPFYAVNLLSEIDMPGEWFIDYQSVVLYFYPPSDPAAAVIELSVADHPFVEANNVSHTSFERFTWELGGMDGVLLRGGDHNLLLGCTVRRCAGNGIVVDGGTSHQLLACNVYSMGRGGMVISGGDRKTLTPGNHLVENCEIYELSRIDHTYTPAVVMSGVKNRIAHNEFHDIASSAIRLGGNDHLVEYNEIHHVVTESDDQGGADMWGNATYRGNVYRYNYWHHIGNQSNPAEHPDCGQAGIRLDDAISGTLIYGNVFHRASAGKTGFGGVQIHGGKDNRIDNNVFVDCMSALSCSAWGDERWRKFTADAMASPEIDPALYIQRYPELERLAEDHDVNAFTRNLIIHCGKVIHRDPGRYSVDGNITLDAPITENPGQPVPIDVLAQLIATHKLDSIPHTEIGLYQTALRTP